MATRSTDDVSMTQIQARITALEDGHQFMADQAKVQEVQREYLEKFREIQKQMKAEAAAGGGGSSSQIAELEALRAENEALKVQLAKKDYRIKHLVQSVESLTS